MKPRNTTCLWFDKDAPEAAQFYAATFPDSAVTAVHKASADYPGGKAGDVAARRNRDVVAAAGLTEANVRRSILLGERVKRRSVAACQ
jgi:hypothetical protein